MGKKKLNCWEYKKCGREPGGDQVADLGECEAACDTSFNGINSGKNAGRFCWPVSGTFSNGRVSCPVTDKIKSCVNCDFYHTVNAQEGTANLRKKFLRFVPVGGAGSFINEMPVKNFKAGERLISQGESGNAAYIIQRGSCLVVVEIDGVRHPVGHRCNGDIIDMMALFTGEHRSAHVEAETDVSVWVINRSLFEDISKKDPDLLNFLSEIVTARFDSKRPTSERTIGDYLATKIIGRGGYSIVYKGKQIKTGQPVVIKMLRHNMAMHADFIDSFKNEARLIKQLDYENIVSLYDCVEQFKTIFIIMEYVIGEALSDILKKNGRLPANTIIKYLNQICNSLKYAHNHGVLHRDINPTNIMIQDGDIIKIIDFGLACPIGTEDENSLGTVAYIAPEQINAERVDERTDIYALGITAYEMVTGEKPFADENIGKLIQLHLENDIPDPGKIISGIPDELRRFILKSGKCDPDERYFNVEQAIKGLGTGYDN